MSHEEYELDPEVQRLDASNERVKQIGKHFTESTPMLVNEEYLIKYEELKADLNVLQGTLELMKAQILSARMPGEKTLSVGRAAAFFREISGTVKVDWESLVRDQIGEVDAETLARYTKPGREGYTQVTVRKL